MLSTKRKQASDLPQILDSEPYLRMLRVTTYMYMGFGCFFWNRNTMFVLVPKNKIIKNGTLALVFFVPYLHGFSIN